MPELNIYNALNNYVANPVLYVFSVNVTTPDCFPIGAKASAPIYNLMACTKDAAREAVGDDFASYILSDNSRLTPFAYQKVSKEITKIDV